MYKFWLALCSSFCLFSATTLKAQNVTNVDGRQDGKTIIVSYSLDMTSDIELWYSEDGGRTFKGPLKKVTGDVGKGVYKGTKAITWNVLEEVEKLTSDQVVFKVVPTSFYGIEMVFVEGGTFSMGSTMRPDESPVRTVTVDSYYISKYEITQEIWEKVMNGYNPSFNKGPKYPVENVSWESVNMFIEKLNKLTGMNYSLPTEAEWEYAARGGNKSQNYRYPGGQFSPPYKSCYKASFTQEVGLSKPNELGIYDMAGNVWEMCIDSYDEYNASDTKNPVNKSMNRLKVSRGGCFSSTTANDLTVTRRDLINSFFQNKTVGFRLVLKSN